MVFERTFAGCGVCSGLYFAVFYAFCVTKYRKFIFFYIFYITDTYFDFIKTCMNNILFSFIK